MSDNAAPPPAESRPAPYPPQRPTISVCVIAFNEEDNITDCLRSVSWADEKIVVDSLSTDRTAELAKAAGARVIQRPWPGHVAQKNFALEQATGEWALSIDADERVTPELARAIQGAVARAEAPEAGWTMARRTFYLGRWIRHGGWYPDRKLRLARRGRARWAGTNPHDHLYADGPTGDLPGDLIHYTYRDISDHLRTIDNFTTIAAKELAARGAARPLLRMCVHPPARFCRMYLLRLGFLDGAPGFIVACLAAYYVFLKYAKLWEILFPRNEKQG